MKTKICHVTMFFSPVRGGQEVYIKNLIDILSKNGKDSVVLQPKNGNHNEPNVKFSPSLPKKIILNRLISNFNWFAFNFELLFCNKLLKQQDIIISNYAFHYPSIKRHKKIIILSHGVLWDNPQTTLFDKYHHNICKKLDMNKVFTVANDTNFLREIGIDIKPGENYFNEIKKNVWFIPNCVDTTYFTRKIEILKKDIILVPRNIRQDRGIHLAIEAFRIFNERNPNFTLLIVGKGTSGQYYDYCQELSRKYNLQEKIKFTGHADQDEMLKHYNEAKVTLIPTLSKEGTSLSALESMACGTPTVITDVAGLKDLPGLKASTDPRDIAKKLEEAKNNFEKFSTIQQREIREVFNLKNWEKAWIKVIEAVNIRNL